MELIYEIFSQVPQQGPGDRDSTRRAWTALKDLPSSPHILDIGCGAGRQTIDLAQLTIGTITALDNYQPFLDTLAQKARQETLKARIETVQSSMMSLPFPKETFDLIWSEGAIYIIGFEKGLTQWRDFLKPGGFLAVTEVTWLRTDPPDDLARFWVEEYPAMKTQEENLEVARSLGYRAVDWFVLPELAWWDSFYTPLRKILDTLRPDYQSEAEAIQFFDMLQSEIDMFRKYHDWYGYVFYVLRKSRFPLDT